NVWLISVARQKEWILSSVHWLSQMEHSKANSYKQDADRIRFMAGRSALRQLLSTMSGLSPHEIPITIGKYGKPQIAPYFPIPCHFNISHSGDRVIIVIDRYPVGVDIERVMQ